MAQALPRTVGVLKRTGATRGADGYSEVGPSAGLAMQILLDEVLISLMRNPALFPKADDYERAGQDVLAAYEMWRSRGWLENPAAFHRSPPAPSEVSLTEERTFRRQRYEHLTFVSGYRPHEGEPGSARYLAHVQNRTAHAYVVRSPEPGRPWLVCLHGFGMGLPHVDLAAFRADRAKKHLKLNLALVVLPMHGPRQTPGTSKGEGFMSIDLIDSVHGMAQAAHDARSVIRWIREEHGDVPVGVYGLSLGDYVASLVASLEERLACVIAGVPATDLPDLYRRHSPARVRLRAYQAGALGPQADAVHRVISPLVLAPKVPLDRRFIFAGAGDRMSTAGQARRLWEHWERPRIAWYSGGHIGFFLAGAVQQFVTEALNQSGLVSQQAVETETDSLADLPPGA
ncbi:MAG TPA: alpha/beta hydrolase [Acidimicrobiales bacterium]|nr:alpha/beta hydrolase [Acidimicrobiales bacterium]